MERIHSVVGPAATNVHVLADPRSREAIAIDTATPCLAWVAEERLEEVIGRLRTMGAEADGEVGDRDPVMAVRDALRGREVDEVIVSTLPKGMSRWLGEDVPSRLRDSVPVPVTVVTQEDTP